MWGRPVGVAEAADGSLLVSDDAGGVIWRVSSTVHELKRAGGLKRQRRGAGVHALKLWELLRNRPTLVFPTFANSRQIWATPQRRPRLEATL